MMSLVKPNPCSLTGFIMAKLATWMFARSKKAKMYKKKSQGIKRTETRQRVRLASASLAEEESEFDRWVAAGGGRLGSLGVTLALQKDRKDAPIVRQSDRDCKKRPVTWVFAPGVFVPEVAAPL